MNVFDDFWWCPNQGDFYFWWNWWFDKHFDKIDEHNNVFDKIDEYDNVFDKIDEHDNIFDEVERYWWSWTLMKLMIFDDALIRATSIFEVLMIWSWFMGKVSPTRNGGPKIWQKLMNMTTFLIKLMIFDDALIRATSIFEVLMIWVEIWSWMTIFNENDMWK